MKISRVIATSLIAFGALAFVACDDGNSASSSDKNGSTTSKGDYDCSVKKGSVVVAPEGGETFKVGDKITVVFGTDVEDVSFRIMYRANDEEDGWDLTEGNSIPASEVVVDGKTCNTFEVVLNPDDVDPSDEALIVVRPYNKPGLGKSKTFKVEE